MDAEAVVVRRHGGPDQLRLERRPVPEPAAGDVLIRVEAGGVAYADVLMRRGVYPETPALPFTPGYDVVGHVVAVGYGVTTLRPGDRVAALTVTGGYSTHALARAALAVPIPAGLPAPDVTALVLNWVTAHQMLHRIAQVRRGGAVLVHGAAGGVGTALLDLARLSDIRAYGSASGDRTAAVTARGAVALDRRRTDVVAEVLRSEPGGVSATFDPVGGPHLHRSVRATARDGTVVSYGISFGVDQGLSRLGALVRQGAALSRARLSPGARVRLYVIAGRRGHASRNPGQFRDDLARLIGLLVDGRIAPEVTVMPLHRAAEAHAALEARAITGKLVLSTTS